MFGGSKNLFPLPGYSGLEYGTNTPIVKVFFSLEGGSQDSEKLSGDFDFCPLFRVISRH
jgi:hypothetical protein